MTHDRQYHVSSCGHSDCGCVVSHWECCLKCPAPECHGGLSGQVRSLQKKETRGVDRHRPGVLT